MDAVEYLKQKKRMTKDCKTGCDSCPFTYTKTGQTCINFQYDHPEKAVSIVEQWAKKHSVRTYKSAFLEKFPDAELGCEDGTPYTCLFYIFGLKHAPDYCKWDSATCFKCWNREVEE